MPAQRHTHTLVGDATIRLEIATVAAQLEHLQSVACWMRLLDSLLFRFSDTLLLPSNGHLQLLHHLNTPLVQAHGLDYGRHHSGVQITK